MKWRHYPEDVLPGLWMNLADLIEIGSVRCPEEVRLELKRQDDGLAKWADKQKGLFLPLDEPIQIATARVLRDHSLLMKATKNRNGADPFVIAANPLAAEAGLNVLKRGGSAVDAAIAVQAMLSLVEPQSSGVGGGAFMNYYDARTGKLTIYDGREVAPAQAVSTMFLDASGKPLPFDTAVVSGRATGVPGAVKMLVRGSKRPAMYPISSSSSRAAHCIGSSPGWSFPAGIS